MVFERYTKRSGDMVLLADIADGKYTAGELIDLLLRQLADYEDTGLTPEGVRELQFRARAAELTAGASLHHIIDLVRAERAGRLMMLPCKIGDTIYILDKNEVYEATIWTIESYKNVRGNLEVLFVCGTMGTFSLDDWGKTVFADEKQALHALAVNVHNKIEGIING